MVDIIVQIFYILADFCVLLLFITVRGMTNPLRMIVDLDILVLSSFFPQHLVLAYCFPTSMVSDEKQFFELLFPGM